MKLACVGDCGVDHYLPTNDRRAGGITLNFAAHARRLFPSETTISVVSALGTDAGARIVRDALGTLDVEAFMVPLEGATSTQTIDLEPSGEKIFVRYEQGVLGDYRLGKKESALVADSDLLVTPHYAQIQDFFDSVMRAPSRGLRVVDFADIAETPVTTQVERYLDCFDIAFFGLAAHHNRLIDALQAIARRSSKLFIVTLGPDGSVAFGDGEPVRCDAVPIASIVDTTGAGDTFAAGFLSEYTHSASVAQSLEQGAIEAGRTIQRLGAF